MNDQTPNRNFLIGGLVLLLIVAAFTIGALWQRLEKIGEGTSQVAGAKTGPKKSVSADDDPVIGDPEAPVTIIEFSDFQCPYCANFDRETFPRLKKEYIDTGKVKFIYRDLPLTVIGHRNAQKAAEAAECAAEENKFWDYSAKLFLEQENWKDETDPTATLNAYAQELGLSADFARCLETGKMRSEVLADAAAAQRAGIKGTPTFFIGKSDTISFDKAASRDDPYYYLGDTIVGVGGALPFAAFKELIEQLL